MNDNDDDPTIMMNDEDGDESSCGVVPLSSSSQQSKMPRHQDDQKDNNDAKNDNDIDDDDDLTQKCIATEDVLVVPLKLCKTAQNLVFGLKDGAAPLAYHLEGRYGSRTHKIDNGHMGIPIVPYDQFMSVVETNPSLQDLLNEEGVTIQQHRPYCFPPPHRARDLEEVDARVHPEYATIEEQTKWNNLWSHCKQQATIKRSDNNITSPSPSHPPTTFTYAELFAGTGAFGIALRQLGGRCIFVSELEEHLRDVFCHNFPEVMKEMDDDTAKKKVVWGDITQVPDDQFPTPADSQQLDLLVGGFPCQPFSSLGDQPGFECTKSGNLFLDIARCLRVSQPKAFLLENVPGLLTMTDTYNTILQTLEDVGYTVTSEIITSRCLTSTKRKRLYIVGFRNQQDDIDEDGTEEETPKPFRFPYIPDLGLRSNDVLDYDELPDDELNIIRLADHTLHQLLTARRFKRQNLAWPNVVCSPLISHYGNAVGRGESQLVPCASPYPPRRFSIRECARLMGFPNWYEFLPPRDHQCPMTYRKEHYRMIGNAVCPPVIAAIAGSILDRINIPVPVMSGVSASLSLSQEGMNNYVDRGRLVAIELAAASLRPNGKAPLPIGCLIPTEYAEYGYISDDTTKVATSTTTNDRSMDDDDHDEDDDEEDDHNDENDNNDDDDRINHEGGGGGRDDDDGSRFPRKRKVSFGNPALGTYGGYVYTMQSLPVTSSSTVAASASGTATSSIHMRRPPLVEGAESVDRMCAFIDVRPEHVPEGILDFIRAHRPNVESVRVVITEPDSHPTRNARMMDQDEQKQSQTDSPTRRRHLLSQHSSGIEEGGTATNDQSRTYLVLFQLTSQEAVDSFVNDLNGKPFIPFDDTDVCTVQPVVAMEGEDGVSLHPGPNFAPNSTLATRENSLLHITHANDQNCAVCLEHLTLPDSDEHDNLVAATKTIPSSSTSTTGVSGWDVVPKKAAILTTVCNHTFHLDCLVQCSGPCPVCRYDHSGLNETLSQCHVCGTTENNFVCLICGVVSCVGSSSGSATVASASSSITPIESTSPSKTTMTHVPMNAGVEDMHSGVGGLGTASTTTRVQSGLMVAGGSNPNNHQTSHEISAMAAHRFSHSHAAQHYNDTLHAYALDTQTQHVWDFAGQGYVHRLIQNKEDGKLVELNDPFNNQSNERTLTPGLSDVQENEVLHRKLENYASQYYTLLKSQLEQQRTFYEGRLQEIRREFATRKQDEARAKADLLSALKQEKNQLSQRLQLIQQRTEKARDDTKFLQNMNESLQENVPTIKLRIQEAQQARIESRTMFQQTLPPLEEKLAKLMLQLEEESTDGTGS